MLQRVWSEKFFLGASPDIPSFLSPLMHVLLAIAFQLLCLLSTVLVKAVQCKIYMTSALAFTMFCLPPKNGKMFATGGKVGFQQSIKLICTQYATTADNFKISVLHKLHKEPIVSFMQ